MNIKKLVVKECACYSPFLNGIKNYCDREWAKDCQCVVFKGKECPYFERVVKVIEIHCKRCGKPFTADNYRQQYCEICKKTIQREKRYLRA